MERLIFIYFSALFVLLQEHLSMMLHVAVLDHGTMWLVVCNVITTNREINLVLVENHNSFGVKKKNWRKK